MNQSFVDNDEKPFAELVQSIREEDQTLYNSVKSKATSYYTIDNFSSIRNEEFILNYEVIDLNQNSSKQQQQLKIENTSFSKLDQSAYCIIVIIQNNSVRNRIHQHISKFSFQVKLIDFTFQTDDKAYLIELNQFIEKNQFDCRFLIFAGEFQDRLVKIIEDFPFIYCCLKNSLIQEVFLESLKLHQSIYYTDLTYTIIRQIIPTAFSLLQDIIYANIEIKIKTNNINDNSIHPLQIIKARDSEKKEQAFYYSFPYIIANNYFYLPLGSDILNIDITDGFSDIKQNYKIKQNRQQEIEEYNFIYNQLKYCQQQLSLQDLFYSIKSEEQFYSVNSIILRDQIQQFNSFKVKNTKENEKLNKISSIIERICSSSDPINEKLAQFFSLRQSLLYRMRTLYFIHQF